MARDDLTMSVYLFLPRCRTSWTRYGRQTPHLCSSIQRELGREGEALWTEQAEICNLQGVWKEIGYAGFFFSWTWLIINSTRWSSTCDGVHKNADMCEAAELGNLSKSEYLAKIFILGTLVHFMLVGGMVNTYSCMTLECPSIIGSAWLSWRVTMTWNRPQRESLFPLTCFPPSITKSAFFYPAWHPNAINVF